MVKARLCNTCRKPIAGITERGIQYWLDVTPLTPEIEAIYQATGRATYHVQPRPGRIAVLDWRNPVTAKTSPARGLILVEHPHRTPGSTRTADPPWVISDWLVTARPDTDVLF